MFIHPFLLGLLSVLLLSINSKAQGHKNENNYIFKGAEIMYAKRFMNYKNNSFQNLKVNFKYNQKWFVSSPYYFRDRDPDQILIIPEGILIQGYFTMLLCDTSGKEIRLEGTAYGMYVSYVNKLLFARNGNGHVNIYDTNMNLIKYQYISSHASPQGTIDLIFPVSDSLLLTQAYKQFRRVPGGSTNSSNGIVLIENDRAKWKVNDGDFLVPSLLHNDNKNVIISNDQGETRDIEIATGKVVRKFTTKSYGTAQFSLDHDDNLLFIGTDKDHFGALLKYSIKGEKLWEYPLPEILKDQKYLQPPAIDSDNNIYAIIDTVLYSLDKDGKLRWSTLVYPTDKYKFQYVTVLGDNSVFVVGANRITHYDKDGKELFQKLFPPGENITTQPVVDPNGCFYFATAKGIYCYE